MEKYELLGKKYEPVPIGLFALFTVLFIFLTFKNISYPLFWADESMTVVGAERVLEFGYPKVHDGKNVFYDLRHSNPTLGIDPETDAYVGGSSWGHYYFGALGVALAKGATDIYTKTGIVRSTFAILGMLGLLLFAVLMGMHFRDRFTRYSFAAAFILFSLLSVSLGLHLIEARYYSLTLFLILALCGSYTVHRFLKRGRPLGYGFVLALLLIALYLSFSPAYFIFLVILGVSEGTIIGWALVRKRTIKQIFQTSPWGAVFGVLLSLLIVAPMLGFFRNFEISAAMAEFNRFNADMYWQNLKRGVGYLSDLEFLWLFIAFKLLVLALIRQVDASSSLFRSSLFLTFTCVAYTIFIARIPTFLFTRYIIYLQPLMSAVILLDFVLLWQFFKKRRPVYVLLPLILIVSGIGLNISANKAHHSGRMAELSVPYKGPLDYTIPFILEKYTNTDSLVVAANYEETSYMYYLGCKVVVGFIGNNLAEDAQADPDVICYRREWVNFPDIFDSYFQKSDYEKVAFEVFDNPINNIPELNYLPPFVHKFKTPIADSEQSAADLYFKK